VRIMRAVHDGMHDLGAYRAGSRKTRNVRGAGAPQQSDVRWQGCDFELMFARRVVFFGGLDLSGCWEIVVSHLERCRMERKGCRELNSVSVEGAQKQKEWA
jgi:hypothetical protein